MKNLTKRQKEILGTLTLLLPQMSEIKQEKLVSYGEGMAVKELGEEAEEKRELMMV